MTRLITTIIVIACSIISGLNIHATALTGKWRGCLTIGRNELPIVLTFGTDSIGKPTVSFSSPMQSSESYPMIVDLCADDSLVVRYPKLGIIYRASVSPERIKGRFRQIMSGYDLTLTPEQPLAARRPQTPVPPYPYTTIDTTFTSADGTLLSTTITLPPNATAATPLVVMVTGSGPQNRDEEIFEHRPFAVIADYLARNGIASLRYDDRGVGRSEGEFSTATTYTFADDARSAVDFARTIGRVGRIGILGHSEGGTIALMLAAEGVPDFIITLAGMAISAKATLIEQNLYALGKAGFDDRAIADAGILLDKVFDDIAAQFAQGVRAPIDIQAIIRDNGLNLPEELAKQTEQSMSQRTPWLDCFITINPEQLLAKVKCPVLALNGDKDTQVNATRNLATIDRQISQAEVHTLPGLNHLFQHAQNGDTSEYGSLTETIASEVLDMIAEFCRRQN